MCDVEDLDAWWCAEPGLTGSGTAGRRSLRRGRSGAEGAESAVWDRSRVRRGPVGSPWCPARQVAVSSRRAFPEDLCPGREDVPEGFVPG
ncbi:hypothetical protein GCM10010228_36960 [Streptomyces massasporeus]|nr:hypothetical protein GCM10010228_36960 [Streptomyces massasporeus]